MIEEGKVYRRKSYKKYVHVKEVTYWANNKNLGVAQIVTGDFCRYYNDSKTSVIRNVWIIKEWDEMELTEVKPQHPRQKELKEAILSFDSGLLHKAIQKLTTEPNYTSVSDYLEGWGINDLIELMKEILDLIGEEEVE
jgi:hypothetical protein